MFAWHRRSKTGSRNWNLALNAWSDSFVLFAYLKVKFLDTDAFEKFS